MNSNKYASVAAYFLFSLIIIFCLHCASPQKSFSKGDYEKSYELALKNLTKGKADRKDKTVLNQSFNEILKSKIEVIKKLEQSEKIEDGETAIEEYSNLILMYNDGRKYLSEEYDDQINNAQVSQLLLINDIAVAYKNLGIRALEESLEEDDKLAARKAYLHFEKANTYAHFPEADSLMLLAAENAILVYYVEAGADFEIRYNWEIDRRFEDIKGYSTKFDRIYYKSNYKDADCIIRVSFDNLNINLSENTRYENFSERVINGYESETDTNGVTIQVPIYDYVDAQVSINTIRKTAQWNIRVSADGDSKYCNTFGNNYWERAFGDYEETSYSGDQRAVPPRYLNNGTNNIPRDEDLVSQIIDQTYSRILSDYF